MFLQRGRSRKSVYVTEYKNFLGVDFSCHPTKVDKNRSPWALNLISDTGGFPEKRPGWETVYRLTGKINGIYTPTILQMERFIVHAGTKLYLLGTGGFTQLYSGISDVKSHGTVYDGRLWLITGREYLVIGAQNGTLGVKNVTEIATIPTTCISRDPTGGGTLLEPVNLLTPKRTCSFLGKQGATQYQLDAAPIDPGPIVVIVNGTQKQEGTDYSVTPASGTVTFVTAPGESAVLGKDNITVTYSKTVEGYADRIINCTVATAFGMGSNNYLFMTGNPNHRNCDWNSAVENPAYFPDTSYCTVGGDQTSIMGYLRVGGSLGIIKESSTDDSTVFLRSAQFDEKGYMTFPTKAGISGIGAQAKGSVITFRDDPIFLSQWGVYAVATQAITQERTLKKCSARIDAVLCSEKNLRDAVCGQWGDYLLLCVNSRCYVADSKKANSSFEYEWFHWDNIPAVVFKEQGETLWFGTADGRICRFKDGNSMEKYSDDGKAIAANWSTKQDDDGNFMRMKSMPAKGSGILIKPYTRSSAKIFISTDKEFSTLVKMQNTDIWDFSDLDFSRIAFNTSDAPQVISFSKRIKSYSTIMINVVNDAVNEGFGIFGIIRCFTMGRFAK